MNKLILLITVLTLAHFDAACGECEKRTGRFYFIDVEIVSPDKYPIIMSGIMEKSTRLSLSLTNIDSLLNSFYACSLYSPDLIKGYERALQVCIGKDEADKYMTANPYERMKMTPQLSKNARSKRFLLKTGETVWIRVTEFTGSIWVADKNSSIRIENSNEVNIEQIATIKKISMPFEISSYKKPTRHDIGSLLVSF